MGQNHFTSEYEKNNSNKPRNQESNHFNGKRYFNPEIVKGHRRLLKRLKFFYKYIKRKSWEYQGASGIEAQIFQALEPNEAAVTFINHASFLIQLSNFNILTDPIWSMRASPFSWIGPKRVREPGIEFDRLPKIDLVIISHNHYDHMDIPTLKLLDDKFKPTILVPIGNGKLLMEQGIQNVYEMDWWDEKKVSEHINITFTPARHFSARWLSDRNQSLWGSYMIKFDKYNVFFAGDTGYSSHFKEIREKLGEPDIAFLPIGAWETYEFMKPIHMNSEDAVRAHIDIGSKKSFAMHFGTFQMSTNKSINQSAIDLKNALDDLKIDSNLFEVPTSGKTTVINMGED